MQSVSFLDALSCNANIMPTFHFLSETTHFVKESEPAIWHRTRFGPYSLPLHVPIQAMQTQYGGLDPLAQSLCVNVSVRGPICTRFTPYQVSMPSRN
jgi:hypothetical protein